MTTAPTEPRITRLLVLRSRLDDEIARERACAARQAALTSRLPASLEDQPELILAAVAHHYRLDVPSILGQQRFGALPAARAVAATHRDRRPPPPLPQRHQQLGRTGVRDDRPLLQTAQTLRTIVDTLVKEAS